MILLPQGRNDLGLFSYIVNKQKAISRARDAFSCAGSC